MMTGQRSQSKRRSAVSTSEKGAALRAWVETLTKAMTTQEAVLIFDNEIWPEPKWSITKHRISFKSGNCTQVILERRDDPEEAYANIRGRIRVLVDAHGDGVGKCK